MIGLWKLVQISHIHKAIEKLSGGQTLHDGIGDQLQKITGFQCSVEAGLLLQNNRSQQDNAGYAGHMSI